MDLKSLLDHPGKLPTIPRVTQRLISSLDSDSVTAGEIAALIETDPVLSAKLLRLANSAYFHVARSIETVDDAIRILGLAMVRQLVLAGGLVGAFTATPGMDLRLFWTHSLHTACAARWLAGRCAVNRDLAFTLGLMHGIGQLHLHSAAPAVMVSLDQQVQVLAADRTLLETRVLGFHFLEVSAALATIWNFPASLVQPLALIANPLAAQEFSAPAALVHLAVWRARQELLPLGAAQAQATYPHALGQRLGLCSAWALPQHDDPTLPTQQQRMPALHELSPGLDALLD